MLIAKFPDGISEITVNGLHQWNYGQQLQIEASDLPALFEVHFAHPGIKDAIVRSCAAVNGVATVSIPDICLEQSRTIQAWIYEIKETAGKTTKTIRLNVIKRVRPAVGGDIPNKTSDKYTEAIAAMNEVVAKMPDQFLSKKGGRISGRLFVDGDIMEVGGTCSTPTSMGITYLRGNSDVQSANIVDGIELFGNGSRASGAENGESDPSNWGVRGLYDTQVGNVIEISKDNKVKFNGEAECASTVKLAKSEISQSTIVSVPGLYCVNVRSDSVVITHILSIQDLNVSVYSVADSDGSVAIYDEASHTIQAPVNMTVESVARIAQYN